MTDKMNMVRRLRRIHSTDTLERVVMHMEMHLPADQLEALRSAADHRRAELVIGRFYDRIPPAVWRFVR